MKIDKVVQKLVDEVIIYTNSSEDIAQTIQEYTDEFVISLLVSQFPKIVPTRAHAAIILKQHKQLIDENT